MNALLSKRTMAHDAHSWLVYFCSNMRTRPVSLYIDSKIGTERPLHTCVKQHLFYRDVQKCAIRESMKSFPTSVAARVVQLHERGNVYDVVCRAQNEIDGNLLLQGPCVPHLPLLEWFGGWGSHSKPFFAFRLH